MPGSVLNLLGRFHLAVEGRPILPSPNGQRLLAVVALLGTPTREQVLARLWPDVEPASGQHRLRSDLWRLQRRAPGVVESVGSCLRLTEDAEVDVRCFERRARRLFGLRVCGTGEASDAALEHDVLFADLVTGAGAHELLPGWDHEWLLPERQRLHHLHLHALETAATWLLDRNRHGEALDLALRAAAVEPLRESAHLLVLRVHIAEHNLAEATRHYLTFARRTRHELGVAPSAAMTQLVSSFLPSDVPAARTSRQTVFRSAGRP